MNEHTFDIALRLALALAAGGIIGLERSYHGRPAGFRTHALVCVASALLMLVTAYESLWFNAGPSQRAVIDPTRMAQGIMTGIGFLGAGVIMKEGFSISGLTTAASLWASSAIGILVGVGFYAAAILLAMLSAASMMWISRLEGWLPTRHAVAIVMQFRRDFQPSEEVLRRLALERGYELARGSIAISYAEGRAEWRFVALALSKGRAAPLSELAAELTRFEGVENFNLSHARN